MPINETLSWNDVGAISTGGSNYVRDAFKGMHAEKVLLLPGTKLYKFNEYNSLAPPNAPFISPWWTSYDAYRHDPGWIQKKKLAAHFHVSIRELGRVTSAVKTKRPARNLSWRRRCKSEANAHARGINRLCADE